MPAGRRIEIALPWPVPSRMVWSAPRVFDATAASVWRIFARRAQKVNSVPRRLPIARGAMLPRVSKGPSLGWVRGFSIYRDLRVHQADGLRRLP